MIANPFLEEILADLQPYIHLKRWVVAFSGGVDSSVLLYALAQLNKDYSIPKVVAIHINHKLQQQAEKWEQHCQLICKDLNIDLIIDKANIDTDKVKLYGLEKVARDCRYQIFNKHLEGSDCLIQGHHKNDQAETILLRLCRGTGLDGLAAIPKTRKLDKSYLIRPMLNVSRLEIINYAKEHNICYITDPSNANLNFSRNFIRHKIIPELESKWPKVIDRLSATAIELKQVSDTIIANTKQQLQYCQDDYQLCIIGLYSGLSIVKLNEFSLEQQCRIIRLWLKENNLQLPSRDTVNKIIIEVMQSNIDANPKIKIADCFIRRYLDRLLLVFTSATKSTTAVHWDWQKNPTITVNNIRLTIAEADIDSKLNINLPNKPIVVKYRSLVDSKMKFTIAERNCSKNLKKLMQEYYIPPWLRDSIPLLFFNNEMISAPRLWVCNKYKGIQTPRYQCKISLKSNDI